MNCSALSLGGCFAPIANWWASVGVWVPWIEFGAVVAIILIAAGLIRWVTKSDFATFTFLGAIASYLEYRRGLAHKPFNPLPQDPQQPTPTPVVPPKPTQRR